MRVPRRLQTAKMGNCSNEECEFILGLKVDSKNVVVGGYVLFGIALLLVAIVTVLFVVICCMAVRARRRRARSVKITVTADGGDGKDKQEDIAMDSLQLTNSPTKQLDHYQDVVTVDKGPQPQDMTIDALYDEVKLDHTKKSASDPVGNVTAAPRRPGAGYELIQLPKDNVSKGTSGQEAKKVSKEEDDDERKSYVPKEVEVVVYSVPDKKRGKNSKPQAIVEESEYNQLQYGGTDFKNKNSRRLSSDQSLEYSSFSGPKKVQLSSSQLPTKEEDPPPLPPPFQDDTQLDMTRQASGVGGGGDGLMGGAGDGTEEVMNTDNQPLYSNTEPVGEVFNSGILTDGVPGEHIYSNI